MDPGLLIAGLVVAVVALVVRAVRQKRSSARTGTPAGPEPVVPQPSSPAAALTTLRNNLAQLDDAINADVAKPLDLVHDPAFQHGVALVRGADPTEDALLSLLQTQRPLTACMTLEVIRTRPSSDAIRQCLLTDVGSSAPLAQSFFLAAIDAHVPVPRAAVGRVVLEIAQRRPDGWFTGYESVLAELGGWIERRLEAGERLSFGDLPSDTNSTTLERLTETVGALDVAPLSDAATSAVQAWRRSHVDRSRLAAIGRVWDDPSLEGGARVTHPLREREALEVVEALTADAPRSVVLVGEPGVGKGTIARVAMARLHEQGWTIFEARASDLVAGQTFFGMLEQRLRELVDELTSSARLAWYVPDLHLLLWAGRTQYSPVSVLDHVLPAVERGAIRLVGTTTPAAFDKLVNEQPRAATAFHVVRPKALGREEALELAESVVRKAYGVALPASLREEAWELGSQYVTDLASPGNVLRLLVRTFERVVAESDRRSIASEDLIVTLTHLTGLPRHILDERERIDLDALQSFFDARVLGQREAVTCLVERVAMIKAGVTDPTRPLGVFLFVGPTGTGKTEIAKALAEFLFGSPERMVRIDMTELNTPESLGRIIGEAGTQVSARDHSLVHEVRRHPFSVVLLDELEKAHPAVWDLFLQVFDDGRLTDRQGTQADFRHAIIIMTSNLGGVVPTGLRLGFTGGDATFRPEAVLQQLGRAFRPEFLNRLDRVVVFRPLGRDTMETILRNQIAKVWSRRGLRNRAWAVEWDDTAISFLLDKGFTPDLGARPLARAVERYLLAPLARTIVNHQYPEGDQFLFVRAAGDELEVVFIDPDAAGDGGALAQPAAPADDTMSHEAMQALPVRSLAAIARNPAGDAVEIGALQRAMASVRAIVAGDAWRTRKAAAQNEMSSREFWDSPSRYSTLGRLEHADRVETGARTAGSLLDRLVGSGGGTRAAYPRDLVQRLAERLLLLEVACTDALEARPLDAFLLVEGGAGQEGAREPSPAFAERIAEMYLAWAARRGMHVTVLERSTRRAPAFRAMIALSGFGAHTLLRDEAGLHVHETPHDDAPRRFERAQARVRVVPQPDEPATGASTDERARSFLAQAVRALAEQGGEELRVTRSYREGPAPLVRDRVKGWRTGRLDRVLGGEFDVFQDATDDVSART